MIRFFLGLWVILALAAPGYAQQYGKPPPEGDAAMAEWYIQWAEQAVEEGRWKEAREVLERAADFADVSSDLSYLLARARFHEDAPKGAVLEALRRGLEADRWYAYSADEARLLEAETLIILRSFTEALRVLSRIPPGADQINLRLAALKGLGDREDFSRTMARALEQYPWDPRPVRLLFAFFRSRYPRLSNIPELDPGENEPNERSLIRIALRRLPLLLELDGELAYAAVPFIADRDSARRFTAAYRATGDPKAASIPAALELGLIDEAQALEELFFPRFLVTSKTPGKLDVDRTLLLSVWNLLRTPESRERFSRNLSAFSGVIMDDRDQDGYPEVKTAFSGGLPESYWYDPDQDGLAELLISFNQGVPEQGTLVVSLKTPAFSGDPGGEVFAYPVKDEDRIKGVIHWEQYPAVRVVFWEGVKYVPRPFEFFYAPVRFVDFAGFSLPEGDPLAGRITRRTLVSFSLYAERPGSNFDKALERVEFDRGIPQRAVEFLDERLVSETEFRSGRPLFQRIDLDLDGRMETIRRFREEFSSSGDYLFFDSPPGGQTREPAPRGELREGAADYGWGIESSQSDWDGDGIFEMGEEYFTDGTLKRAWNLNRDGVR
ncbi:MAG: hypothetical protein LBP71_02595 [Spirochaetaceae bacterium]|jgi:tetratricopeptide (TPR) repeat protein|nr:hypothetical protein [Spirochaetaceae bacterium]